MRAAPPARRGAYDRAVFATISGPLPPLPDDGPTAESRLRAVIGLQLASGIGLLADGREPDDPADAAADPVGRWRAAQRIAGEHPVKAVLAGPLLATRGAAAGERRAAAHAAAATLRARVEALAEAGCPVVEIAEAAPDPDDPDAAGLLLAAHARLTAGVSGRTHLHLALAAGAERVGERLYDLPYRSVGFDLIGGPDDWRILVRAPGDRGVVCGAIDPASPGSGDLETALWAAGYAASTKGRGPDRVGLTAAPGLDRLTPERLAVKLRLLGEAARLAVAPREEVDAIVDPRAIVGPARRPPGG